VGLRVGARDGRFEGALVGVSVGEMVGAIDGGNTIWKNGTPVFVLVGVWVGVWVGVGVASHRSTQIFTNSNVLSLELSLKGVNSESVSRTAPSGHEQNFASSLARRLIALIA